MYWLHDVKVKKTESCIGNLCCDFVALQLLFKFTLKIQHYVSYEYQIIKYFQSGSLARQIQK